MLRIKEMIKLRNCLARTLLLLCALSGAAIAESNIIAIGAISDISEDAASVTVNDHTYGVDQDTALIDEDGNAAAIAIGSYVAIYGDLVGPAEAQAASIVTTDRRLC